MTFVDDFISKDTTTIIIINNLNTARKLPHIIVLVLEEYQYLKANLHYDDFYFGV